MIEIKTHKKLKQFKQDLQIIGLKIANNKPKAVTLKKINNQAYYFTANNYDVLKFYKNKSISISGAHFSNLKESKTLLKLIEAIEKEL